VLSLVFVSMRNSTTAIGEMGSSLCRTALLVDVRMYMCQRSKTLPCSDVFRCCFIPVLIRRFERFCVAGWPNRMKSLQSSLSFAASQFIFKVFVLSVFAPYTQLIILRFQNISYLYFIGTFSAIFFYFYRVNRTPKCYENSPFSRKNDKKCIRVNAHFLHNGDDNATRH